ncbi:MAG: hypothetical protein QOI74_4047 [Micromonosporaceae bacterium]|jgi:hypothetical protein|nr:hypothetical protein [Micromonosporaceae bacterium]
MTTAHDSGLNNRDPSKPTEAGEPVPAVAESSAIGDHASQSEDLLAEIEREAAAITKAEQALKGHTAARDHLIRSALGTELRRVDIARSAGVKEARLYQIRDGRR